MCVQDTDCNDSKAGSIGAGFKGYNYGVDGKRNRDGVILKEEYAKNVVEVKRLSNRVMSLSWKLKEG